MLIFTIGIRSNVLVSKVIIALWLSFGKAENLKARYNTVEFIIYSIMNKLYMHVILCILT